MKNQESTFIWRCKSVTPFGKEIQWSNCLVSRFTTHSHRAATVHLVPDAFRCPCSDPCSSHCCPDGKTLESFGHVQFGYHNISNLAWNMMTKTLCQDFWCWFPFFDTLFLNIIARNRISQNISHVSPKILSRPYSQAVSDTKSLDPIGSRILSPSQFHHSTIPRLPRLFGAIVVQSAATCPSVTWRRCMFEGLQVIIGKKW